MMIIILILFTREMGYLTANIHFFFENTGEMIIFVKCFKRNCDMKIVILDGYAANPGDLSWNRLKGWGELTVYDRTLPSETVTRAADADVVLTNKVILGRAEIERLPHLRYIGVLATGYNVVDIEAAHEHHITVTNVPAYSTESVAQMVFAHLLTVTNRTEHYTLQNCRGRWTESPDFCYWDTPLTELAGKCFGIVGLGNIGQRVAAIAHAFGMQVSAFTSKSETELPPYITKMTLTELFEASDVLSLHCPLTPTTRHLINAQSLKKMKPTAILINTGRGPLVDEQAVATALIEGQLAAFCADVLTEEPPKGSPLLQLSQSPDGFLLSGECRNAFITPHIAWATKEARIRLLQVAIDNVAAFLQGHPVNTV